MLGTVIATSRQPNWRQTAFKRFQDPFVGGIPANHVVVQGHEHPSNSGLLHPFFQLLRNQNMTAMAMACLGIGIPPQLLPLSHSLAVNKPSPRAETTKATWAPCYERNGSTLIKNSSIIYYLCIFYIYIYIHTRIYACIYVCVCYLFIYIYIYTHIYTYSIMYNIYIYI